jgi:nitrate reductase NapAB chaperone NapD
MVVASGVIKVDGLDKVDNVVEKLKKKNIRVDDINGNQIIFIMEAEAIDIARCKIENLRDITHVKDVHLLFYSFEDR